VRILIAGLGAIGQRHARNLRALCGDGIELLAFRRRRLPHVVDDELRCDESRDVEAELALTVFEDLDEGLAMRPDAVFVCTPTSGHLEIALRAAAAGCHLFIEKPVSHTLDGTDRLREIVASNKLIVLVGCQWRYHPCVRWLRDLVNAGTLGRLTDAEIEFAEYLPDWHSYEDYRTSYAARSALGGGVVLTQIHDYDLAWWLFGPPRTVVATGGHLSTLDIDVEDAVDARLEGGQVPVRVRQNMAARPARRSITITGEQGSVTADLLAARITTESPATSGIVFADYRRSEMFLDEMKHFCACLTGEEEPVVPLEDGIAVLRVALAVRESMRTGRTVEIFGIAHAGEKTIW
jgi:predicted dehydrogenase